MDDDDLRRGKPTNHKVFGDAIAVLAGDALLTYSFEVIGNTSDQYVSPEIKVNLIIEMAKAAGTEGMVGGQVADMLGEEQNLSIEELEYIHIHKTGKILAFCVKAGALIAGASEIDLNSLSGFAHHLGLAFQIRDDILDLEGNEELIGKPVGSDEANNKSTYPALLSMDWSQRSYEQTLQVAKDHLKLTKLNTELLEEITDLVVAREY